MKKIGIAFMLSVMMLGLSSCNDHFWSVLSGSRWYAYLEVQGNFERDIYENDLNYMEFQFYTNGTGDVGYYDDYGRWVKEGFDWEDHGDAVSIYYYAGGSDYYYYDYNRGILMLAKDRSFYNYVAFSH